MAAMNELSAVSGFAKRRNSGGRLYMRIEDTAAFLLLLITCTLPACSENTFEGDAVPRSATIEIQQTLRSGLKTVRAPSVIEITDPMVLLELRSAVRATPDEASGSKTLWTAIGSITFVDEHGVRSRFLIGDTHWALTGDDLQYPLPEGFKERLVELFEANSSKK